MSEEATLDDFTTEEKERHTEKTIDAVPESSVESSLDETSAGKIPDGWIATKLGDIAEETEYGLTESAEDYDPEKPRYIRTQDFDDFGGLKQESKASLSCEKAKDGMLEKGDLLFARSGSVGASLGKTYLYDTDDGNCCFGGYSIRHRLRNRGLNHKYISQYTLSGQYWDWVRRRAKTTAQSNINTGEYGSLLIPIPPLPEQRKIATVLYTVDQAIEKTENIIRQFERVHQGLFQNLIPGGIGHDEYDEVRILGRTVQIPANWGITTVSQACSDIIDYRGKNPEFSEDGIPHLRNININRGEITLDDLKYVSQETYDEWMTRGIPQKEDTLLSTEAPMGKTAVLPDIKFSLSQRLIVLSPGEQFDNRFFTHLMGSPFVQKEYEARATGSTVKGISNYNLQEVTIPVLPKDEQKQITQYVDDTLKAIQKNEEQVNHLKRLKRGLMQDLLSGTVRTTDTNIEVPEKIAQYG